MAIRLSEDESVERNGESYAIGDKVYSTGNAKFGVGYVEDIEVLGVHFGFRAKISSQNLSDTKWYDARCMQKEQPDWVDPIVVND